MFVWPHAAEPYLEHRPKPEFSLAGWGARICPSNPPHVHVNGPPHVCKYVPGHPSLVYTPAFDLQSLFRYIERPKPRVDIIGVHLSGRHGNSCVWNKFFILPHTDPTGSWHQLVFRILIT